MTIYEKAPQEIIDLIELVKSEFHPELVEAGVTIDALLASNDRSEPIKPGGYPALAVIRNNSLKNRVNGMADAEITIDALAFKGMTLAEQRALIDHELYHLIVQRDKEDNIKRDDLDRPKLKMRKHDYQMGWFRAIAIRHKDCSPEVYQAKILWREDAATFFPKRDTSPQSDAV